MSIHPNTGIGHVHLTVSDLDRALAFYRDVLGFEVTSRYGRDAVFLSAGGYHHHIGLNTWAGRGAPHLPGARRVCTTSRFSTRTAKPSPGLYAACSMPVCRSKAQPTTASAKRSTCGTPTATASSCTATDQRANGPGPPTAPSPCRRGRWISRACWPRRNDRPTEFLSRSSYRSPSPPAPVSGRIDRRAESAPGGSRARRPTPP